MPAGSSADSSVPGGNQEAPIAGSFSVPHVGEKFNIYKTSAPKYHGNPSPTCQWKGTLDSKQTSWWCQKRSQGITDVRRHHHQETINDCTNFHGNLPDSCWDMDQKICWLTKPCCANVFCVKLCESLCTFDFYCLFVFYIPV